MTHILGHYADAGGNEFFPRNYLTAADMDTQVAAWQKAGVSTADMNRRLLGATVGGVRVGGQDIIGPEDILREAPQQTFFSFQNQFGRGPTQRSYFQGQFQEIFNQYLGMRGQQLRRDIQAGGAPSAAGGTAPNFLDFMGDFNFSEQFAAIPPSMRGGTTGRFAPSARFLNF